MDRDIELDAKRLEAKCLVEKSLSDPRLAATLCVEELQRGNYSMAIFFSERWILQKPDQYLPYHAKFIANIMGGDRQAAWRLLVSIADMFHEDPGYINDKLIYLLCFGSQYDAERYLHETSASTASNSFPYLCAAATIYERKHDFDRLWLCLERLANEFHSENALYQLAILCTIKQDYTSALQYLGLIMGNERKTLWYYLSLQLSAVCGYAQKTSEWQERTEEAARMFDKWSTEHIETFWLRQLSAPLWKIMGNEKNAQDSMDFVAEFERFVSSPEDYFHDNKES